MGTGYLIINARYADQAAPVTGADVKITDDSGSVLFEEITDQSGSSKAYPLPAPDKEHTLDQSYDKPAYSVYNVQVSARGYVTSNIIGVQVVDTQTSILPVDMRISPREDSVAAVESRYIPPIALISGNARNQSGPSPLLRLYDEVFIPDYITVHLGTPANASARNLKIRFIDYIKNVASSEIYSTWPYNSLVANIHVIITFAINRVYTEWYRSRGYIFDITNSTAFDMAYREGGPIFLTISDIVDNIFNTYAHRAGFKNPLFTSFCNGSTVLCAGLSQWGTVSLANQGLSPLQILRRYYPSDVELTSTYNIHGISSTYPGYSLRLGSQGDDVLKMQNYLNRIGQNYPLIPQIINPSGFFDEQTQAAVKAFQRVFNMSQDGIIGPSTWNKISYIYVAIKRLAELDSEGEQGRPGLNPPTTVISQGSRGQLVSELQFMLNYISNYYPAIPLISQDGIFGENTRKSVVEFQKSFGLDPDGIVGVLTWRKLYEVFSDIEKNAPSTNIGDAIGIKRPISDSRPCRYCRCCCCNCFPMRCRF